MIVYEFMPKFENESLQFKLRPVGADLLNDIRF